MGRYTKAPGMHEFAYNSWLLKIHRRLNDRAESAKLNRDGRKKDFDINFRFQLITLNYCQPPEFVITKTKRVNCNPMYNDLKSTICNSCLITTPYICSTIQLAK